MMTNYRVIVIAFSVLVCNDISLVQCDECKTNTDCKNSFYGNYKCCGGYSKYDPQRSCTYADSCLHRYCSSDSDCGDSSLCCRSNQCVKDGCLGCTSDADCDRSESHVCCKKTFPSDQTVCAANCINQDCKSNDDCASLYECCRSGKCTETGCDDKCKSNSECNSDQYCCKKADIKNSWSWNNKDKGCAQTCVDKLCSTSEDCGPPNECCISNKCVDKGCSGCTTNSNCSTGQYCCKKQHWYEVKECSADCIGKSCSTSDDCGGPGETCDSNYRCTNNSFPPWLIAVITASLVVFFIVVGVLVFLVWNIKRKQALNARQTANVPLLNTQYQGQEGVQTPQPNTQFSGISNPTYHENRVGQNQPSQMQQTNNAAYQPSNSTYCSQNGAQNQFHNPQLNYQPLETPSAPPDTGQQMYPQNTPYQANNYNYPPPEYSSLSHGNH